MFERFTKEARAAVVEAKVTARESATRNIDTRHLLAVLIKNPGPARVALADAGVNVDGALSAVMGDVRTGGLDAEALAGIGIDLDAVSVRADATFGPDALQRAGRRRAGHIPFTREAKRALQQALREAIRLQQRRIDGGHLMLGILEADRHARTLLAGVGADLDALRAALERRSEAA